MHQDCLLLGRPKIFFNTKINIVFGTHRRHVPTIKKNNKKTCSFKLKTGYLHESFFICFAYSSPGVASFIGISRICSSISLRLYITLQGCICSHTDLIYCPIPFPSKHTSFPWSVGTWSPYMTRSAWHLPDSTNWCRDWSNRRTFIIL